MLIEDLHGLEALTSSRTAWKGMSCRIEKPTAPEDEYQGTSTLNFEPAAFASETDIQQAPNSWEKRDISFPQTGRLYLTFARPVRSLVTC